MNRSVLLFLAGLFIGVRVLPAEAPNVAADAAAALDLYPGLEATLFASEPLIGSPTNIDVDRRGRVWVCDVKNYRAHAKKPVRPKGDRILILEDTDGDGVADKRTVFYEGRDVDAALGICVLGDQVIVSCAPNIIVFTDADGDDVPESNDYLFTRTGRKQDDHSTHSVVLGPDGKLYWNFGNHGREVHDKAARLVYDVLGHPVIDQSVSRKNFLTSPYRGGMAFRCDRDGSRLEVLGHNFRNNYELAVDSLGNVWQTDNDDDGNYGCRINFVMEGGNFGYREERTGASWRERRVNAHREVSSRHWHQNDPGVVPNFIQTGAGSPTGITVYEGRLLPEIFWDQPIACDAGPGVVWCARAAPIGAGFHGKLVNLVKGERDKWFRPVDVAVAPDGSLFVSDWYDPHVGWNRQGDLEHGRIYRIAPKGHRYEIEPPANEGDALTSPNADVRLAAKPDRETLRKLFDESPAPRHRARALWRLCTPSSMDEAYLEKALADEDPQIRLVALRAGLQAGLGLELVRRLAQDPSPQVRREGALALRKEDSLAAARVWATLASQHVENDRWYLEALGIGATQMWDSALTLWLNQRDDGPFTLAEEEILWRSRSTLSGKYLVELLKSGTSHLPWEPVMRAFDFLPDSEQRQRHMESLAFGAWPEGVSYERQARMEAILRIDQQLVNQERWLNHMRARYSNGLSSILHQAVTLSDTGPVDLKLAVFEHLHRFTKKFHADLVEWASENPSHPQAGEALRIVLVEPDPKRLREKIKDPDIDKALAFTRLLGQRQNESVVAILTNTLLDEQTPMNLRQAAVEALGKGSRGIEAMVKLAEAEVFPDALKPAAGIAIISTYNVNLHDRAAKYFPPPPIAGKQEIPQMTDLIVYVGDPHKGKAVFAKATCHTCHVVGGEGASFGPDLSYIGSKLSKQALYEAILNPNADVSPNYQLHEITFTSGNHISGFIENESDKFVTVRTADGLLTKFARDDIKNREALRTSAMPSTLTSLMTVDELVDLVAYLTELKATKPSQ